MSDMPIEPRNVPTVVVSRRAEPGREAEFETWMQRLHTAAQTAPGHVRSDVRAPNEHHPGEWMIVYQFDSVEYLDEWLDSSVRNELIDEGQDLVASEPREQIVAMSIEPEPVTAVASFRLESDSGERFARFDQDVRAALAGFDGYLGSRVYEPVPGVQDDTVIAFSFDSRAHLDAWLESPERAALLETIDPVLEGERVINVVDDIGASFGGWFGNEPDQPPVKRWKQATIILVALFPTSLSLSVLRGWLLPDLPLVASVLGSNIVGIALLTWLLMPYLTRLFDRWLRR